MQPLAAEFTPERERSRDEALLARALRTSPAEPLWVLCPREGKAGAFERAVAAQGGGFVQLFDWSRFLDVLERGASLPLAKGVPEAQRGAWVEQALAEHASGTRATALTSALKVDGFGVASALLPVLDELRLCGFTGARAHLDAGVAASLAPFDEGDPVLPLLRSHLALLADAVHSLEASLAREGAHDHPARLARLLASPVNALSIATKALYVTGVDRLAPQECAVLSLVSRAGVRVDVAPWVLGWQGPTTVPVYEERPAQSALEAFSRMPECAPFAGDDRSVLELVARDPDDEADAVARYLSSLDDARRGTTQLLLPADPGYAARVARALERHGLAAGWSGSEPASAHPLWQVVRASVRLAWTGPDAVDLATVLSAPGGGIWGADRDRLCARLRRRKPVRWEQVLELLDESTDPERVLREEQTTDPSEVEPDAETTIAPVLAELEAARRAEREQRLRETRERVGALIELWSNHGPFTRIEAPHRAAALRAVTEETIKRFSEPARFREAFDKSRVAAAWTVAARAITEALRAVRLAQERAGTVPQAMDPAGFLAPVERLLGSIADAPRARRADIVRLGSDPDEVTPRPETLVVLGFQRGRYPSPVGPRLLLGPVEVDALRAGGATSIAGLAHLADEGTRARLEDRACRRALALPTETLVLLTPLRDAAGELKEPSLSRRDVLRAYAEPVASKRLRTEPTPAARWARALPSPSTHARIDEAARALRRNDAAPALAAFDAAPAEARDAFFSGFLPERDFDFGELLRERVARDSFSTASLETLLKCRYSFAATVVLGLRDLTLARRHSVTLRDRTEVALAALRALEYGPELDPFASPREDLQNRDIEVAMAVDAAVEQRLPTGGLAREALRREVHGFVDRYRSVRETIGAHGSRHAEGPPPAPGTAPPERPSNPRAAIALPSTEGSDAPARVIHVTAEVPRVELVTAPDGSTEGVLVQVRNSSLDKLAPQRSAGLALHTALGPAIAEKALGVPITAVAAVSFNKQETELVARSDRTDALASTAARTGNRTRLRVAADTSLEAHRAESERRLAKALEELVGASHDASPHTPAHRAAIVNAQGTTCEYCAARLLCRYEEPRAKSDAAEGEGA